MSIKPLKFRLRRCRCMTPLVFRNYSTSLTLARLIDSFKLGAVNRFHLRPVSSAVTLTCSQAVFFTRRGCVLYRRGRGVFYRDGPSRSRFPSTEKKRSVERRCKVKTSVPVGSLRVGRCRSRCAAARPIVAVPEHRRLQPRGPSKVRVTISPSL
jgi:hypothetical protein